MDRISGISTLYVINADRIKRSVFYSLCNLVLHSTAQTHKVQTDRKVQFHHQQQLLPSSLFL